MSAPRKRKESRVEAMTGVFSMPCRVRDGGAGRRLSRWPSVVALQGEITNHPKVLRSRAVGAERWGKSRACERGRCDPLKANASKPQMTCRKVLDDIKSGSVIGTRDEPGECLLIGQAVSGIDAARAWVRLLHGTWEPVVPRDGQPVVCDLRLAGYGRIPSGRNREDKSTDAGHRGGPSGSSDEGPVMGLERSGRAVQMMPLGNHEAVGGANG
jgi:hypothetical protein